MCRLFFMYRFVDNLKTKRKRFTVSDEERETGKGNLLEGRILSSRLQDWFVATWRAKICTIKKNRLVRVLKVSSAIISPVEVTDTESVSAFFLPLTSFSRSEDHRIKGGLAAIWDLRNRLIYCSEGRSLSSTATFNQSRAHRLLQVPVLPSAPSQSPLKFPNYLELALASP